MSNHKGKLEVFSASMSEHNMRYALTGGPEVIKVGCLRWIAGGCHFVFGNC